ncbi:hypothetical protein VTO42DRAFT_7178 [Malbranchea cinnamomea]
MPDDIQDQEHIWQQKVRELEQIVLTSLRERGSNVCFSKPDTFARTLRLMGSREQSETLTTRRSLQF